MQIYGRDNLADLSGIRIGSKNQLLFIQKEVMTLYFPCNRPTKISDKNG